MYCDEAEKALLGAIILGKAEIISALNQDDFTNGNGRIFEALCNLYQNDRDIDIITVGEAIGNYDLASQLCDTVVTAESWKGYFDIVKKQSSYRKLQVLASRIKGIDLKNFENAADLNNAALALIEKDITADSQKAAKPTSELLIDVINDIEDEYQNGRNNLLTGYEKLDRLTGGFIPGDLTVIGARPGVGKTAFTVQLMLKLANKRNNCIYITREMLAKQLMRRIVANISGVNGNKFRYCKLLNEQDWLNISRNTSDIAKMPFEIVDDLSYIQEIRTHCKLAKNKGKLDVLFVDYLGLIKTMKKCESRRLEFDDVTWNLKMMALDLNIPVIVLAQLNRNIEQRRDSEPQLSDLKESGGIEQDADCVMFLHEPNEEEPENQEDKQNQGKKRIKLLIRKQRNGPTGHVWFKNYPHLFRYYDN